MSPEPLRIGDAERERAQAALADHYVEGRLDHDEYTERLDGVWAARTHADLAAVFVDLPGDHRPPARPAYSTPASRGVVAPGRPRRRPSAPLVALMILLFVPAVLLVGLVVAGNLPWLLLGLGAWFFLVRGGCRGPHRGRAPRHG
jgi:hypothetical protein